MKKGIIFTVMIGAVLILAGQASAHFGMVIPSDSMVMPAESRTVGLVLSFSHPFEGIGMTLARPKIFAVDANGRPQDLRGALTATRVMGHSAWTAGYGKNFFDTFDYLASNWMLPLGGLLTSIYAGWIMPRKLRKAELEGIPSKITMIWLVAVRFVAPILVVLVLLQKVGIIELG